MACVASLTYTGAFDTSDWGWTGVRGGKGIFGSDEEPVVKNPVFNNGVPVHRTGIFGGRDVVKGVILVGAGIVREDPVDGFRGIIRDVVSLKPGAVIGFACIVPWPNMALAVRFRKVVPFVAWTEMIATGGIISGYSGAMVGDVSVSGNRVKCPWSAATDTISMAPAKIRSVRPDRKEQNFILIT
jgi:hypothetical protein